MAEIRAVLGNASPILGGQHLRLGSGSGNNGQGKIFWPLALISRSYNLLYIIFLGGPVGIMQRPLLTEPVLSPILTDTEISPLHRTGIGAAPGTNL